VVGRSVKAIGRTVRPQWVLLASLAVVVLSGVSASAASAKPAWKFNGAELKGVEIVAGVASPSSLSLPGVTVTCEHLAFVMNIWNVGEVGRGELTELWPFECHSSNPNCIIEGIEAKKVPWPAHAVPIGGLDYVVIEGVDIGIRFGGALCTLSGLVEVKGTAGGLFAGSTLNFSKASFEATGTVLRFGVVRVEWTGVFAMEAFGEHREQTLELL
jgi:hypothetical protein